MDVKEEEKSSEYEIPFDLSLFLNKDKLFATIQKQSQPNLNFKKENILKLQYLPGQDQMCFNTLTHELSLAEKNKNEMLQISLLGSLSNHKELNEICKLKFLIERWKLCKKYNMQTLLKTIINQLIEISTINIFTRIGIAYSFLDQEDLKNTSNALFEILRVNSIFFTDLDAKEDSAFQFQDELNYIAQIRRQKIKISFQNYFLLGISNDTSLFPEIHHTSRVSDEFFHFCLFNLCNRSIFQASSGDNHYLMITSLCCCQLKEYCKCPQKSFCELYLFGCNNYGQLDGIGKNKNIKEHVWSLSLKLKITHICGKGNRTVAVTAQGEIYEWGYPNKEIKKSGELEGITKVEITCTLNIFLTNDKEVYLQGFLESEEQTLDIRAKYPLRLKSLFEIYGVKFNKISCGLTHVLLLTTDNNVYSFGYGKFGQLGLGKCLSYSNEPVKLPEFLDDKEKVIELICGSFFSLCLTSYGILYEWGLLKSDLNQRDKIEWMPKIHYLNEEMNFMKLGGERHFIYGITEEGLLYSWDLKFQLTFRNTKIKVENVKSICCTIETALFIQRIIDPFYSSLSIEDKVIKKNTACKLKLNIRDSEGLLFISDINSIDCFFILTLEEIKLEYKKIEEVKKETVIKINNNKNEKTVKLMEYANKSFHLSPQTYSNCSEISLNEGKGIVDVQLICKNIGIFFLHTIIGDKYISNSPIKIEVIDEDFQKEIPQEEEKVLPQRPNTKQIEKAKKEEMRMLLQKKKIENEEITKQRAKQAFEKFQLEKKKKVQEIRENRKTRLEIITGGGFDLEKLNRIKTSTIKPQTK